MKKTPSFPPAPQRRCLRAVPASEYLSIGRRTLDRLVSQGLIRPKRVGRIVLFPIDELDRFLDEAPVAKPGDVYSPAR